MNNRAVKDIFHPHSYIYFKYFVMLMFNEPRGHVLRFSLSLSRQDFSGLLETKKNFIHMKINIIYYLCEKDFT